MKGIHGNQEQLPVRVQSSYFRDSGLLQRPQDETKKVSKNFNKFISKNILPTSNLCGVKTGKIQFCKNNNKNFLNCIGKKSIFNSGEKERNDG